MISIITPTHNPQHLRETYISLLKQTNQDWEWIIVPNGKVSKREVVRRLGFQEGPPIASNITISKLPEALEGKGIGAIKQWSFMQGTGDYLLELDHDDLLAPTALEECVKAFKEIGADFVYSNTADFFPNGKGHWFPDWQKNGWRYRCDTHINGTWYNECLSFAPSAASLGLIYYAPNHFRAWRKGFYHSIGGHNPNFRLADDHELLIRTYLQGKMHHIDKCLYLYRMGENNTFSKNLGEIARLTNELYIQNIEALILRESELRRLPCYDLGGGFNSPQAQEWKSVDLHDADIICDLNERWPWEDSSVLAFRAFDIFEHLRDKQHVMREASRCLVNGGYLHIQVPDGRHAGAHCDPTHISYWVPNSFHYYTRTEQMKYIRNTKEKFIEQRLFECYPSPWHETNDLKYVKAELICIKDGREGIPGVLR